jgi:hypothetical protein
MKAPMLGLAIATAAFGGSSLYLWNQLRDERAHSVQVTEATRQLNARIAELEKARGALLQHRLAAGGPVPGALGSPGSSAPATVVASSDVSADASEAQPHPSPLRSPAFQKMIRSHIRANVRRQYSGVGEKLGLGKDTTAKLLELLAEQQAATAMGADPGFAEDSPEAQRVAEQNQREQELEISDLIGPDKALALKEYQETIPARMEFDMLARQLEDSGVALNEAQKKQLIAVVIEERQRVAMPDYVDGMDQVEYAKSVNAWKDDYDKRIAAEAGQILNADQLTAYNEVQQWQRDLRDQFASQGFTATGATTRIGRAGTQVKIMDFAVAAPVQGKP